MNHIFDTEDERQSSTQLKFPKTLIHKLIKRLEEDSYKPKVQDALRAIQLKEKLSEAKSVGVSQTSEVERSETHRAEKMFWEAIEAIRRSELPKLYPEPTSLQVQIQETILGLKDLVKNNILPLKTITDLKTQSSGAFNQARSKQGRLTYSRLGGILSGMGFTNTKTPNGCSAIIWDDQLLSQNTFSTDEKNEK